MELILEILREIFREILILLIISKISEIYGWYCDNFYMEDVDGIRWIELWIF